MDIGRFGSELARMRRRIGLTQEGLVDRLHQLGYCSASYNYIAHIERGARAPNEEQLWALLQYFVNKGLLHTPQEAQSWVALLERTLSHSELEQLFGDQVKEGLPISQSVWSVPRAPRYYVVPGKAMGELEAAVSQDDGHGQWPVVVAGMAGVGKTTLLHAFAHSPIARARFGYALWADLAEGNSQYWQERWGEILGLDLREIRDPWTKRGVLEDSLRDRNALLLIDDVWEASEVKPLLVGGPTCRTVIATREEAEVTVGLRVDCRAIIRVEPLETTEEGLTLLRGYLGEIPVRERQCAAQIVHLVGGLPMALEILAFLLRQTGDWQEILNDLRSLDYLPAVLATTGRHASAWRAFQLGYDRMDKEQQRCFRVLGALAERATFDRETASVLWAFEERQTQDTLISLQGRHLVRRNENRRYRLHGLLHRFARSRMTDEETETSYYLLVQHFEQRLETQSEQFTMSGPETVAPGLAGAELDWPQAQELAHEAARRKDWESGYRLFLVSAYYLTAREQWSVLDEWCERRASSAGHRKGSEWADVMRNWGLALIGLRRYEEAVSRFEEAVPWMQNDGDRFGIYMGLADTFLDLREREPTLRFLQKAEPLTRQYPKLYPRYQRTVGLWESSWGDPVRALQELELAEGGFRGLGAYVDATSVLEERAQVHYHIGYVDEAVLLYKQAAKERAHYGQQRDQLRCLLRAAMMLWASRGSQEALRALHNELLELWEQVPDERKDTQLWIDMGFLAESVEDIVGCRRFWSKALTLPDLSEHQKAVIRLEWAAVETDDGDPEKARELLRKAAPHFMRVNDEDDLADVRRLQSRLGVA